MIIMPVFTLAEMGHLGMFNTEWLDIVNDLIRYSRGLRPAQEALPAVRRC